jgi:hypothetical protein
MYEYFLSLEKALLHQAEASNIFSSGVSKGRAREIFIHEFLQKHLPSRLVIKRGEIIDSVGNKSGEVDAIIVDHESVAYNIGGEHFVSAEAAVAGIEIKSDLTGDELKNAVEKTCLIKKLSRSKHHGFYRAGHGDEKVEIPPKSPNAYIVGFRGPSLQTIAKRVSENPDWYSGDFLHYGFDILCILEKGFMFKNDGLIFNPELGPGLDFVIINDRSGIQQLIGHMQVFLERFGSLTYELERYYE